jgi:hypothetical protein
MFAAIRHASSRVMLVLLEALLRTRIRFAIFANDQDATTFAPITDALVPRVRVFGVPALSVAIWARHGVASFARSMCSESCGRSSLAGGPVRECGDYESLVVARAARRHKKAPRGVGQDGHQEGGQ